MRELNQILLRGAVVWFRDGSSLKSFDESTRVEYDWEEVNRAASIVAALFLEIAKHGERLPPDFPVCDVCVVPAAHKLKLLVVGSGRALGDGE